jgi:hypothetical protein
MEKKKSESAPTTYVIKRGKPIEKYSGYEKTESYLADENLGACDCIGFSNNAKCKHMEFKGLLNQFTVDELIFFGKDIGECKPMPIEKLSLLIPILEEALKEHFKFSEIDLKEMKTVPTNPSMYSFLVFHGKRDKTVPIVGYMKGVMFLVKPAP